MKKIVLMIIGVMAIGLFTSNIFIHKESKITNTYHTAAPSVESELPPCVQEELEKDWSYTTCQTSYESQFDSEYWNLLDTEEAKMFYEAAITTDFTECRNKDIYLFFGENTKKYDVSAIRRAIQFSRYDHPEVELLAIDFNYKMEFYEKNAAFVGVNYYARNPDMDEYYSKVNEVNSKIQPLVNKVNDTNDLIEKHRLIFDWITFNVRYNETGREVNNISFCNDELVVDKMDTYYTQNIYGAIVKKEAICDGIADAYKYICNLCNLECMVVNGSVVQGGQTLYHAWNIVKVDGKWYLIDATWDIGTKYPSYFMVDNLYKGNRTPANVGTKLFGYSKSSE